MVLSASPDSVLPPDYEAYLNLFYKVHAGALPPPHLYDCAKDLQPIAFPPHGRFYPLSVVENEAMEEYVADSLSLEHIRKSTYLAGDVLFFVKKKGSELRPFNDYRVLNCITMNANHFQ